MANLGNMYPNLPGMLVEFKDGGSALRFNETEAQTDSLLLLGTAVDGPVMEPVAVDNDSIELIFGSELRANGAPNGATLVHAYKQAADAGCKDIRVMRISGDAAKATIGSDDLTINSVKRKDEDLSIVQGNDATVLTLTGNGINAGTVKVLAKGVELNSGFSYTSLTKKVTINKNVCDAGSSLVVKYEYTEEVDATPQTLNVNDKNQVTLAKVPVSSTVVIKDFDGEVVGDTNYTINGRVITFKPGVLLAGDAVTIEYKYSQTGFGSENGAGSEPFVAATSPQTFAIKDVPVENSLVLYIDDAKVLDSSAFSVNIEAKTVEIKKEKFQMGQRVSVSYYVDVTESIERKISVESKFAGAVYNTGILEVVNIADSLGAVIGKAVKLTKPESKRGTGEETQVFTSFDYPTFGDLVDAINEYNGVYKAETETPLELVEDLKVSNSYFSGGDDGVNLTKDQIFRALSGERDFEGYLVNQGVYQLLENYQVDYVVPCGVYADDELADRHQNFAYELAMFCAVLSYKNKSTYGMIAMKPLRNTSLAGVQDHAKYLASYNNTYFMRDAAGAVLKDREGNPIDLGKFISVVAGPTPVFNHKVNALREANPAVMYAGFNTTLQPQSAPTNKKLTGSRGIKYTFSNAQLDEIVANRLVVFGTKYARNGQSLQGCFVIDGPTSARPGSEYARLTTLKVIREVADQLREVADPYIGEANTIEQRNALSAAISKRLDILSEKGVLLDYSFNLVATAMDQVLGQARLELGIVAPQELRKITTVIGLKR